MYTQSDVFEDGNKWISNVRVEWILRLAQICKTSTKEVKLILKRESLVMVQWSMTEKLYKIFKIQSMYHFNALSSIISICEFKQLQMHNDNRITLSK